MHRIAVGRAILAHLRLTSRSLSPIPLHIVRLSRLSHTRHQINPFFSRVTVQPMQQASDLHPKIHAETSFHNCPPIVSHSVNLNIVPPACD
jgi:hypothetical protein